ncbi:linear amide C-N hydrolase [Planctomicrobium sp. SH664]|uniref:linear amide C-N hydrolase n=1 Tax=Planctomicrobium sp. SH664 TaxID=3448125 RepID=UPI003F5BEB14
MLFPRVTRPTLILSALVSLTFLAIESEACTRFVFLGDNNQVVVARSMDWAEDPHTEIYSLPRGMKRNGAAGKNSLEWTSKYGSVICSFYDAASVDGMNEKGLVANTLYLVESNYGKPDGSKPLLSIGAWAQYALDNFATVDEAVAALEKEPFRIAAPILPNGDPAQGHLAISDPSGDSAIFEYIDGKLHIHHGRQYQVMTNSPAYEEQLALTTYWNDIGGFTMLPGTNRAADRFVRASFYLTVLPTDVDLNRAIASVASLIRSVSVPLGITTPGEPNIASTMWRTIHDQKNKVVYFDSASSPTVFWVPLDELDFSENAPVKKLALKGGKTYQGSTSSHFNEAKMFEFLPWKE